MWYEDKSEDEEEIYVFVAVKRRTVFFFFCFHFTRLAIMTGKKGRLCEGARDELIITTYV